MPGGASQPRKQLDAWQEWAKQRGARGLAYVLVAGGRRARRPGRQEPHRRRAGRPRRRTSARSPATASSSPPAPRRPSRALLGAARLEIGRRCGLIDEDAWSFLWVVDAPLFEPAADATRLGDVAVGAGAWTAVHHAFTSPKPEFLDTFDTDPGLGARLRLRHRLQRQRDRRRLDPYPPPRRAGAGLHRSWASSQEEAQEKFGFLLDAFAVRRPAARRHRLRLGPHRRRCSRGTESIRDVIAFPKSGGGYDPLTAAPAPITPEQRKEAGVDAKPAGVGSRPPGRTRGQPEAELSPGLVEG